jgi:CubicO group peptidase (beta-lactamase class C family)
VQDYLPRFTGAGKEQVTVRMLLDHTSGLRPFLRFYQLAPTVDSARSLLYAEPLSRPAGTSPLYSDLNAMLLGELIERITGLSLQAAIDRDVILPLGLHHTRYLLPDPTWRLAVPTGRDAGEPVLGIVNDRNCDFFGGVTGHAGLFSTGEDLARVAAAWLRAAEGRDSTWLHPATVRRFLARHPMAGTRLLGWDSRDTTSTTLGSFGLRSTASAFGHTGWTGTQIVIDPGHDRWIVFLTNRSFSPRRTDTFDAMRLARGAVVDAALAAAPRR